MNDSNQPVQNIQNVVQKLETNSCTPVKLESCMYLSKSSKQYEGYVFSQSIPTSLFVSALHPQCHRVRQGKATVASARFGSSSSCPYPCSQSSPTGEQDIGGASWCRLDSKAERRQREDAKQSCSPF